MNGLANGLDLSDFIKAVRAELSDLTDEEQRELLDGLEADLVELVADQGEGALGDPTEYAEELRLAAGLGLESEKPRTPEDLAEAVQGRIRRRSGMR